MAVGQTIKTVLTLDSAKFTKGTANVKAQVAIAGAAMASLGAIAMGVASKVAGMQDSMIKSARSAGATAEEFSKLSHAASMSGVSAELLQTSMTKMAAQTPKTVKGFNDVGISMSNVNGTAKTSSQLMADLADKIQSAASPSEKTAIAVKALGQEGAKMVSMLSNGSKGLANMAKEAEKLGIVVSTKAGEAAEKFNDDLALTQKTLQGLTSAIGESIIAFANKGEIMERINSIIQGITERWRNLDDSTKNIIVTVVAVVAVFGTLMVALTGIMAIAPAVAAAWAMITGPIGLAVLAVGALIAAMVVFSTQTDKTSEDALKNASAYRKLANESDQTRSRLIELNKVTHKSAKQESELIDIKRNLESRAKAVGIAYDGQSMSAGGLIKLQSEIEKNEKAIAKATLATAVAVESMNVARLAQELIELNSTSFLGVYERVRIAAIPGEVDKSTESIRNMKQAILDLDKPVKKTFQGGGRAASDLKSERGNLGDELTGHPGFVHNITSAYMELGDIMSSAIVKNKEFGLSLADISVGFANVVGAIADTAGEVINAAAGMADAIAQNSRYAAEVQIRDLEVVSIRSKKAYEENRQALEESENDKIRKIESSYDAQIGAIRSNENFKITLIQTAANERLLALDSEYQSEKALREAEFQKFIENERIRFEQEKELALEKTLDKEQRQLNDKFMDEEFRRFTEQAQAEHEAGLSELAKDFATNQRDIDAGLKSELKLIAETNKDELSALNTAKNDALTTAEEEKSSKLLEIDKKRTEEEKAEEKRRLEIQYNAQLQEFNQMKAVKIAETTASSIASAAQAFASLASIPFVGVALGAAAAATILGTMGMRISQLSSQKPVKPAALIAETGGFISGPSHSQGGVDVNAEGGELILSEPRTAKLFDMIDGGSMGGQSINIIFESGSVNHYDRRELADMVSDTITVELRRQGIAAA